MDHATWDVSSIRLGAPQSIVSLLISAYLIEPFPSAGVDGLADCPQDFQGGPVMLGDKLVAMGLQCPDQRRRCIQLADLQHIRNSVHYIPKNEIILEEDFVP